MIPPASEFEAPPGASNQNRRPPNPTKPDIMVGQLRKYAENSG